MPTFYKRLTSNQPVQITGVSTQFTSATFWGYSGFHPSGMALNNVNNIYLGQNSGQLVINVASGSFFNWSLVPKVQGEDLANFWVKGEANDGIYGIYYP